MARYTDINMQVAAPAIVQQLKLAAQRDIANNPVIASRYETLALLLEHVEDDSMWKAIFNEQP